MKRVLRALERHWFARADLRDLAAVRIAVVALYLATLLVPDWVGPLGIAGVYGLDAQRWLLGFADETFIPIPTLKLLTAPFGEWGARPSGLFVHTAFWLAVASGITALVGLATRISTLCFAATTTFLIAHAYSYGELHHPQTLPTLALWVLPFAPIGGAWSLDAMRGRIRRARRDLTFEPVRSVDRTDPLARWPIRTIQWLLVLAYLSAGVSKLEQAGFEWLNGYRILRHIAESAMGGSEVAAVVGGLSFVGPTLAVLTLLFELTFVVAVLAPRLTIAYVLVGTLFHIGIYVLIAAPFVGWPLLYVVLLENLRQARSKTPRASRARSARLVTGQKADAARTAGPDTRGAPAPARRSWTVYYDDVCPLCVRTMVILDALDFRRRLAYIGIEQYALEPSNTRSDTPLVDERHRHAPTPGENLPPDALRHAMHVMDSEGVVYRGFFAFRALSRVLPALWPLLPLLYLPGAAIIGPRAYERVAGARGRVTCRAGTCRPDARSMPSPTGP